METLAKEAGFTLLFLLLSLSGSSSESMRNLSEIRYRFTTCGKQGSSGPQFSQCHEEYSSMQSPITREGLLVDLDGISMGSEYYRGAQRLRVPRTGLYNVTVAGAAGGRGICSTSSGRGLVWRGTVFFSATQDLLVLVGQSGVGPCDQIATRLQDLPMCLNPPTNLTEVQTCEQEWMTWLTNTYSFENSNQFLGFVGGGGGGGASFILPVTREGEIFNNLPIVIAPGGGGSAAIERHDIFDRVPRPSSANVSDEEQYRLLINAQTALAPPILGVIPGSRGRVNESIGLRGSASLRPGAGGGWNAGASGIDLDGGVLGSQTRFAIGGQGCSESLRADISLNVQIPVSNVNGGFGGGGGQCGGGGAGGGYTGGTVYASSRTIPSGGGYFFGPQDDNSNFSVGLNPVEDGYVDIVPVNCGCAHDCTVYQETFKCFCPSGFELNPNEVDCFQGSAVNVTLLSPSQRGDIIFTPMILNDSLDIFGLSAVLESVGVTDGALWSCSIFLIGNNNEIVATTRPVRENGATTNSLARVNSSNVTNANYQSLLTTHVTVTGVLLASLGGCSVSGMSLKLNISIVEPGSEALVQEDFSSFDYSVAQTLASQLLPIQQTVAPTKDTATIIGVVVGVSALVLILMVLIAIVGCVLMRLKNTNRLDSIDSVHPKGSHNDYSSSLTSNPAYRGKNYKLGDSQHREEINRFYEPGPPTLSPSDGEGYESISYEADGMKRRSMKRRTSINASARFFSPRHGISAPEHDFTPFNMQRSQNRNWEYPRKNLVYLKELGEGEFGKVLLMKAQGIADYRGEIPVAVKTLSFKNQHLLDKFMEEINLMKKFAHPNIVGLLGISTKDISEDSAPLMILEYMPFGDLHSFLSKHKPTRLRKSQKRIGPAHFFSFSKDVAEALAFLSSQKHVHRDIAARNCLVGTGLQVKIADFGMARRVSADKEYYKVEGNAVLPIRWLAPESLLFGIFSTASDVWSYGVLLWEILTFGELPLADFKTNEIVDLAEAENLAHPRPPRCPDEIFDVMRRCHIHNKNERITFDQIVEEFSKENIVKLMGEKEIQLSGVH